MLGNIYDRINDYGSVKISLASPNDIRSWSFGEVRKAINDELSEFLSPLPSAVPAPGDTASPSQSPGPRQPQLRGFGQDLHPSELYGVILGVENVRAVRWLEVSVNGRARTREERDEPVVIPPDGLIYGAADHVITIEPDIDL